MENTQWFDLIPVRRPQLIYEVVTNLLCLQFEIVLQEKVKKDESTLQTK
jgi:hypothetical protein